MTPMRISEIPHRVLGRTSGERSPLSLFWTGAGLELVVRGSELWVEMNADWELFEPWYSFEVNGVVFSRRMARKGEEKVCVFRGMDPSVPKRVRILKDTQATPSDPKNLLQIVSVESDGTFLPVPEPALKLEFIGDSITSGEGDIGAPSELDWISLFFSIEKNYAYRAALDLGADFRIFSQSGWGVCCGWDNNPRCALPSYYDEVCGVVSGARNEALGAGAENDFAAWQPDAVFINLGTNDCGAFSQPAWHDEKTGETFQNRRLPDGAFHPEDLARLANAVKAFLKHLRLRNPKAALVWVYGMLGHELEPTIRDAVESYCAETGDRNAAYLSLTDDVEHRGCRSHPGPLAHETAAREIEDYLRRRGLAK